MHNSQLLIPENLLSILQAFCKPQGWPGRTGASKHVACAYWGKEINVFGVQQGMRRVLQVAATPAMTGCWTARRPRTSLMCPDPISKTPWCPAQHRRGIAGGARTSDDCEVGSGLAASDEYVVASRVDARESHVLSCCPSQSNSLSGAINLALTRLLGVRARRVLMCAAQSCMDMQSSPGPCSGSMAGCSFQLTASQHTEADNWLVFA